LKNTPPTGSKESNQYASVAPSQSQLQETTESPLRQLANRPYLELLEMANSLNFTAKEIEGLKQHLESEKEAEKKRLEQEEKRLKSRIEQSHKQLEVLNKRASRDTLVMVDERRNLQCQIYKLE
jgi:regulator of replication initiation timing